MHNTKFASLAAIFTAIILLFSAAKFAQGANSGLIITEVMYNPAGADDKYEWIELYNLSNDIIPINKVNFGISDSSGVCHKINSSLDLAPGKFAIIADDRDTFLSAYAPYPDEDNVLDSSFDLKNSDTIKLSFDKCAHWQSEFSYSSDWGGKDNGKTLEKIDLSSDNGADNWQENCEENGTPGKESEVCQTKPVSPKKESSSAAKESGLIEDGNALTNENYQLSDKIYLNEIFPNPENDSNEEYIEIKNGGNEAVDLYKWFVRDGSKSGKYVFKNHIVIGPDEYLSIYKSQSKLSLNNSDETVYLLDPQNNSVSSVSYGKTQKGSSYNFDGESWHWSKYLTPGGKNKFDSEPKVRIKKPQNAYKNLPAKFSAKAKDEETKKLKYVWDFGDGGKSYLKKTSHKYLKTGKYTVKLCVSDNSQTVEKKFSVRVKNSPRPDVEIVKIVPNPAGADTDSETIDIKNSSKKKVDLSGWKIATGSDSGKMYNHPISDGLYIDPDETKTITREISKFSLNNKAGRVALIMPDGKVIDNFEYSKDKITDDEVYAKINGKWRWLAGNTQEAKGNTGEETEFVDDPTGEIEAAENGEGENEGEILGATDENMSQIENYNSGFSSENAFPFLNRLGFGLPLAKPNYCPLRDSSFSIAWLLALAI